jgi:5'-nucleotidase
VVDKSVQETVYNDPVEAAQDMVRFKRKDQQCDMLFVCHLGV